MQEYRKLVMKYDYSNTTRENTKTLTTKENTKTLTTKEANNMNVRIRRKQS